MVNFKALSFTLHLPANPFLQRGSGTGRQNRANGQLPALQSGLLIFLLSVNPHDAGYVCVKNTNTVGFRTAEKTELPTTYWLLFYLLISIDFTYY